MKDGEKRICCQCLVLVWQWHLLPLGFLPVWTQKRAYWLFGRRSCCLHLLAKRLMGQLLLYSLLHQQIGTCPRGSASKQEVMLHWEVGVLGQWGHESLCQFMPLVHAVDNREAYSWILAEFYPLKVIDICKDHLKTGDASWSPPGWHLMPADQLDKNQWNSAPPCSVLIASWMACYHLNMTGSSPKLLTYLIAHLLLQIIWRT